MSKQINMAQSIINNNLTQKVLEKIRSGKVKMRSRFYFVLKAIILVLAAGITVLMSIFLASFIAFALKMNGPVFFLTALALAALIFVLLAWLLAEKFSAFYKKPLVFGLALVFILVAISSAAVLKTPFHQKMLELSQQKEVPIISPFYKCGCGCGCSRSAGDSGQGCGCMKQNSSTSCSNK